MDSNTNAINIDTDMLINDILEQYPASAEILMNCGMHCVAAWPPPEKPWPKHVSCTA